VMPMAAFRLLISGGGVTVGDRHAAVRRVCRSALTRRG
jgi:hypothetical protein